MSSEISSGYDNSFSIKLRAAAPLVFSAILTYGGVNTAIDGGINLEANHLAAATAAGTSTHELASRDAAESARDLKKQAAIAALGAAGLLFTRTKWRSPAGIR